MVLDLSTHYFGRPPTTVAAADLVELARATLDGFDCTHHAASNLVVELAGDEAVCRTHMVAYHHVPAEPGVVDHATMRGYWQLELRKLGGQLADPPLGCAAHRAVGGIRGRLRARRRPHHVPDLTTVAKGGAPVFYEIRTEHARAGRGAELAAYMDGTVIPLHQELGMHVVGSFTVSDDEDAFVWIRRFDDAAAANASSTPSTGIPDARPWSTPFPR